MAKRIVIIFGIVAIIAGISYQLLTTYAVNYLRSRIQENIAPGFTISQISATARYISLKDILIVEPQSKLKLFGVEEVRVYPAIRSLFDRKKILLHTIELIHPTFFFYRTKDSVFIGIGNGFKKKQSPVKGPPSNEIIIDKISTQKGEFYFTDQKNQSPPAQIHILEIESAVRNFKYPLDEKNRFPINLKGKIFEQEDGRIELNGWLNFKNADMQFTAGLAEVNVKNFEPYYKKSFGAIVEKGFANMTTTISMRNKIINVSGKFKLFDLTIDENRKSEIVISSKNLSEVVKNNGNQIKSTFTATGNMKDTTFKLSRAIYTSIGKDLAKSYGINVGKSLLNEDIEKGKNIFNKLFRKKK